MKKKIISTLSIILILSLLIVPFALASSYSSSLSFSVALNGATREYTHDDLNITVNNPSCSVSGTFRITLIEDKFVDVVHGSIDVSRSSTSTSRWNNVGSGNYFFRFTKASDGAYVTSNNVSMWCD